MKNDPKLRSDPTDSREVRVNRLRVVVRELRNDHTHHKAQRELHEKAQTVALLALQQALRECYSLNMNTQEIWGDRPWKDEEQNAHS